MIKSLWNALIGALFTALILFSGPLPAFAASYVQHGVIVNNNTTAASPGEVGEIVQTTIASTAAVTLTTTATPYNLLSFALTPGQWECLASLINTGAGTTQTLFEAAFNTTSATLPTAPANGWAQTGATISTNATGLVTGKFEVQISALTTYYLVMQSAFTGTAPTAYGQATCVRIR